MDGTRGAGRLAGLAGMGAAAAIALLACAPAPRVEVDAPAGAVLSGDPRYAIDVERLAAGEPAWGPSARETARRTLREALAARGLEESAEDGEADLVVAVGVSSEARSELEPGGYATDRVRVERRRTGLRTPVGDVPLAEETRVVHEPSAGPALVERAVHERSFVVEVRDAESDRLLWRGASRRARSRAEHIDLADLERRLRAIAAEIP